MARYENILEDLADEWDELLGTSYGDMLDDTTSQNREEAIREIASELNASDPDALRCIDATLIHEDEFTDRMQDEAISCGMIDADSPMLNYIDWDDYARDVQSDYTTIDIDGVTYYFRY